MLKLLFSSKIRFAMVLSLPNEFSFIMLLLKSNLDRVSEHRSEKGIQKLPTV